MLTANHQLTAGNRIHKRGKLGRVLLGAVGGLALLGSAHVASASPFLDLTFLGNTDGSSNYSSSVTALPGQTVYYELVAQIAPTPGVTNSNSVYTLGTQTSADGINSVGVSINSGSGSGTFGTPTLNPAFNNATGTSAGTASGSSVSQVYAAQSAGTFTGGTSQVQVLTGEFTVGSAQPDTITGTWNLTGASDGGIKIHTSTGADKTVQLTSDSESSNDPLASFTPLNVNQTSVIPEPASLAIFGIAGAGLLIRKRRSAN